MVCGMLPVVYGALCLHGRTQPCALPSTASRSHVYMLSAWNSFVHDTWEFVLACDAMVILYSVTATTVW